MKQKYLGITIGPIFETISRAKNPAAMWLASYMFSYTAKCLCERIYERVQDENAFISPAYAPNRWELQDGVGLFHDRIIIKADEIRQEEVQEIIAEVKQHISRLFESEEASFLVDYLAIHLYSFETEENPILACGSPLDALELMKPVAVDLCRNPIPAELRQGHQKKYLEALGLTSWQLGNESRLVSVDDIARGDNRFEYLTSETQHHDTQEERDQAFLQIESKLKKWNYFAVLQSDGDNMSTLLKKIAPEEIRQTFSEKLFCYSQRAAKLVEAYGGITIYAGGDDLLALVPLESKDALRGGTSQNLLELLWSLKDAFNEALKDLIVRLDSVDDKPTLSFGVSIQYNKAPLYEAYKTAGWLLFGVAKRTPRKNAVALSLQKHSGRTIQFLIKDFEQQRGLLDDIDVLIALKESDEFYNRSIQTLRQHKALFACIDSEEQLTNAFQNIFDRPEHFMEEEWMTQYDILQRLYIQSDQGIQLIGKQSEDLLQIQKLYELMSYAKFFNEEGEE